MPSIGLVICEIGLKFQNFEKRNILLHGKTDGLVVLNKTTIQTC